MTPLNAPRDFHTTRWTAVRRASSDDDAEAAEALGVLYQAYWYPIYAFIRRSNRQPSDAEDLTQDFFALVIRRGVFTSADQAKGKLRTLLLTCLRHFLADAHHRAAAQKRGGAFRAAFDSAEAETRYALEPVDEMSPDRLFQRRWAITMLDSSLHRLREEYEGQGKAVLFEKLRPFLGFGTSACGSYEDVSAETAIPLGTVKSHVFRLRHRWREILFEQVATTLDNPTPEEIKEELMELMSYF